MRSVAAGLLAFVLMLSLGACKPHASGGGAAFGGAARLDKAFVGKVYYLADGTQKLPDFHALKPVGVVYARNLDVPDQDFTLGFPGVTDRNQWFALDYRGAFIVSQTGRYGFRLSSDDGSRLYVDKRLVVDDDGLHATRSAAGAADLAAGRHSIEVQYFQGPPTRVSLQLFCTAPAGNEAIFPGCGLKLTNLHGVVWMACLLAAVLVIVLVWLIRRRPALRAPGAGV